MTANKTPHHTANVSSSAEWVETMLQVSNEQSITCMHACMHAAGIFQFNYNYYNYIAQECQSPSQAMFTASVQNKSVVWLTREEWRQIGGLDGVLSSEWCTILSNKLCEVNSYCTFAFKKGWIQRQSSRKRAGTVPFRAKAYCTFSDCSITCEVHVTNDDNGVQLHVTQHGQVSHKRDERRARHIKGVERKELQSRLEHSAPSAVFNDKMEKLSLCKLVSGSRDGIGQTKTVLQKISSEAKKKEQRHENLILSLMSLQEEFYAATIPSKDPGYIRKIQCSPFSVMLYTEAGVRIYHHMVKHHTLYCDATGTIVTLKEGKRLPSQPALLYYSLVFQHPNGGSPVAVAEMITAEHDITSVSHFLECFRRQEGILYGWKNTSTPYRIVIDRSLVLLNSFLRVYCLESLQLYLHRCFRVVSGCAGNFCYKL